MPPGHTDVGSIPLFNRLSSRTRLSKATAETLARIAMTSTEITQMQAKAAAGDDTVPLTERRKAYNIMVPAAHSVGAIAAIRSLGRAGYRVHAVSGKADALGLKVEICDGNGGSRADLTGRAFHRLVRTSYVESEKIDHIVIHGAGVSPVRIPWMREFGSKFALPEDPEILRLAASKYDLFVYLKDKLGADHLPPFLAFDLNETSASWKT